jgi:broad specificity phosphatase PhoE
MKKLLGFFLIVVMLGARAVITDAQQAIFLVRHTEQAGPGSTDPPLTEAGRQRAKRLAGVLKDAGIDVIFVSTRKRAVETGEPVAKALGLKTKVHPRKDYTGLVNRLRTEHMHDRVLVVSHSRHLPRLLKALGHPLKVKIAPLEYDNLFVIVPKSGGELSVLQLRY